jgi:uncharacterized protein
VHELFGRSVAVIGSGVAGLTAACALAGNDRVTLYQADTRLGGHAHTHFVDRGDGTVVGIDSAFLVHNDRIYPTLCRLFAELGVATQPSEMSMSVRTEDTGLEYAGARGIRRLFASWHSARPRYLLMLAEVIRFPRLWRERFLQRRKTLAHIGFDEVFSRMWELYLAHAEAGFGSRYLNVYQWTFVNEAGQ